MATSQDKEQQEPSSDALGDAFSVLPPHQNHKVRFEQTSHAGSAALGTDQINVPTMHPEHHTAPAYSNQHLHGVPQGYDNTILPSYDYGPSDASPGLQDHLQIPAQSSSYSRLGSAYTDSASNREEVRYATAPAHHMLSSNQTYHQDQYRHQPPLLPINTPLPELNHRYSGPSYADLRAHRPAVGQLRKWENAMILRGRMERLSDSIIASDIQATVEVVQWRFEDLGEEHLIYTERRASRGAQRLDISHLSTYGQHLPSGCGAYSSLKETPGGEIAPSPNPLVSKRAQLDIGRLPRVDPSEMGAYQPWREVDRALNRGEHLLQGSAYAMTFDTADSPFAETPGDTSSPTYRELLDLHRDNLSNLPKKKEGSWDTYEVEILLQGDQEGIENEIISDVLHRSIRSMENKRKLLKEAATRPPKPPKWDSNTDAKLRDLFDAGRNDGEISDAFGDRAISNIYKRRKVLNLKRETALHSGAKWSHDDMTKLQALVAANATDSDLIKQFPNRTPRAIKDQKSKMRTPNEKQAKRWTAKDRETLLRMVLCGDNDKTISTHFGISGRAVKKQRLEWCVDSSYIWQLLQYDFKTSYRDKADEFRKYLDPGFEPYPDPDFDPSANNVPEADRASFEAEFGAGLQ
ncbi:hypothetical protein K491DRAFT_720160 [Lophiostoma macrostomum CBS 122681]|uniref:Myb-like domain-containing protein n=1 Tax=Lophiostoma macrostomum CBS 122681 TaxID=1314788 RepID=A0A6A6SVJ5_9PLEO|nr:hypothetical protein K491DRAFT_720160 [Lophiostoma macrostomum CBS 122681]